MLRLKIIFTVKNKNELNLKYNEIKESINEIGFEETARIYSLSDSKKSGGNLGWIYKNQLSEEIREELNELNIGAYTKPIVTGGGFLPSFFACSHWFFQFFIACKNSLLFT